MARDARDGRNGREWVAASTESAHTADTKGIAKYLSDAVVAGLVGSIVAVWTVAMPFLLVGLLVALFTTLACKLGGLIK